jgi:hypothetical protein
LSDFVPLGSAVVAAVFAVTLAAQYSRRRRLHQLIWTVSMSLIALGALLEFVMSSVNVTGPLFDLYYVSIGPEVGLLGAGVVYLLRPRLGKYVLYAVLVLSAALVASVFFWPVDISGVVTGVPGPVMTYQQWFQSSVVNGISYAVAAFAEVPRDITQILNGLGALLVIGGGLLSFVMDRKRYYALLIALGALMNAVGGILLGVLGDPDVFLYFEFIGIVIFYIGFVMSSRFVFRTNPAPSASSVATPAIRSDS